MGYEIKRVAVLGAGVMGQGIAAHLANAGIPSVLFDIVPQGAEPRSKLAIDGIANATKLKPAAFYTKKDAAMITPANYEDDAALLAGCDLIIEVVVENLNIKKKVFGWVAEHRRAGSIVASNTSGLSLADMSAVMEPELAQHFLSTIPLALDRGIHRLSTAAHNALVSYHWPGNVRELENVIRRACVVCDGPTLLLEHLPQRVRRPLAQPNLGSACTLKELERRHILQTLADCGGNQSQAARRLGIHRNTLRRKLEEMEEEE